MIPDLGQLKKNYVKENQLILKNIYIYQNKNTGIVLFFFTEKYVSGGNALNFFEVQQSKSKVS